MDQDSKTEVLYKSSGKRRGTGDDPISGVRELRVDRGHDESRDTTGQDRGCHRTPTGDPVLCD